MWRLFDNHIKINWLVTCNIVIKSEIVINVKHGFYCYYTTRGKASMKKVNIVGVIQNYEAEERVERQTRCISGTLHYFWLRGPITANDIIFRVQSWRLGAWKLCINQSRRRQRQSLTQEEHIRTRVRRFYQPCVSNVAIREDIFVKNGISLINTHKARKSSVSLTARKPIDWLYNESRCKKEHGNISRLLTPRNHRKPYMCWKINRAASESR